MKTILDIILLISIIMTVVVGTALSLTTLIGCVLYYRNDNFYCKYEKLLTIMLTVFCIVVSILRLSFILDGVLYFWL